MFQIEEYNFENFAKLPNDVNINLKSKDIKKINKFIFLKQVNLLIWMDLIRYIAFDPYNKLSLNAEQLKTILKNFRFFLNDYNERWLNIVDIMDKLFPKIHQIQDQKDSHVFINLYYTIIQFTIRLNYIPKEYHVPIMFDSYLDYARIFEPYNDFLDTYLLQNYVAFKLVNFSNFTDRFKDVDLEFLKIVNPQKEDNFDLVFHYNT